MTTEYKNKHWRKNSDKSRTQEEELAELSEKEQRRMLIRERYADVMLHGQLFWKAVHAAIDQARLGSVRLRSCGARPAGTKQENNEKDWGKYSEKVNGGYVVKDTA